MAISNSTLDREHGKFVESTTTPGQVAVVVTNSVGGDVGGGTQYVDGAATPAHPTGTMPVFDSGGTISEVSKTKGLPVSQAGSYMISTALQTNAVASGNGTVMNITGFGQLEVSIISSIALSGGTTVNFEASNDNFVSDIQAIGGKLMGSNRFSSTATQDGVWSFGVSGFQYFRARISAYSAGTTTITGYANVTPDSHRTVLAISPKLTILSSAATPITTNTNTSIVSAPSAGNHLKIYRIYAQNSSSTGTWLYWTEGSGGTKKFPMFLTQYQVVTMNIDGSWELPTATALFINTATTGSNTEWEVSYEIVPD